MLGPEELKRMAQMIDPNQESEMLYANHKNQDIDISHLDYAYVASCQNYREIETLLDYLKTGKEGYYPDLEEAMTKRIEQLNPSSIHSVLSPRQKHEEEQKVQKELSEWLGEMEIKDEQLNSVKKKQEDSFENSDKVIETKFIKTTLDKPAPTPKAPNSNRIKSYEYSKWDKFVANEENENELVDVSAPTKLGPTSVQQINIPSGLTEYESASYAEMEKNKGNECMKAKEFDQALLHYNASLKLLKTIAVLNNRSLCYLKLKKYSDCIDDCTESLKMSKSFKALLRRCLGLFHSGRYQDAIIDIDSALELEKDNKEALELKQKVMKKWATVDGTINRDLSGSKRMEIVEVDDDDDEQYLPMPKPSVISGPRIVELEDDVSVPEVKEGILKSKTESSSTLLESKATDIIENVDYDSDTEEPHTVTTTEEKAWSNSVTKEKIKVRDADYDSDDD
ncbi:Sperm associated antigen 1 [Globomyces sp. JEL0801]|nr:Sperm associated antigen 1 [Globomyces sp. JEL0801]